MHTDTKVEGNKLRSYSLLFIFAFFIFNLLGIGKVFAVETILYNDFIIGNNNRNFISPTQSQSGSQSFAHGTCFQPTSFYSNVNRFYFMMAVNNAYAGIITPDSFRLFVYTTSNCVTPETLIAEREFSNSVPFASANDDFPNWEYHVDLPGMVNFTSGQDYIILIVQENNLQNTQQVTTRTFASPDRSGINDALYGADDSPFTLADDGSNFFSFAIANDTDIPPDNTATRISITQPINNSTTTTPVDFEIQYYINSSTHTLEDDAFIELQIFNSMLASGTQFVPLEIQPVIYDALVTATTSILLPNNQTYLAGASIVQSETCGNPLVAVVLCGWWEATKDVIISTNGSTKFLVGTNPFNSIEDFGNSVFSASGLDEGIFSGQCAFVATSTCDGASPSKYPGCLMNVGLRLFCPSTGAINYATSTLSNVLNNKIPFGFFTQTILKLGEISATSSAPTSADDIVVHIDSLGNASTTIFSWSGAKSFMDEVVNEDTENIIIYVEWIIFAILAMLLVLKIHD